MTSKLKISSALSLPLDVVTEATAIVATRGAGKSSASAVIVEEAFDLGVQVVVFDRTGVYWGLRSNAKGNGPGIGVYVLGGPHADVPLEEKAGVLIADLVVDSGHSFVLDLSDFSKSAAVRFAADFVERLYDRKARNRATTLLVIDEAHFYAPQTPRGGFKGDSARLMGAMEDAVGLGRSRGLGVVLTTQRTQALNKAILDLIETLLVMRMLSPRARNAVKEWIQEKHEEDEQGVIPSLDSLPTGTAWVWSPLRGILEKVAIRRIQTFDSYATPKPGETRLEPKARTELDLTALGEQMRATVERAKAEDPKELRKQLAEARRELAKRPTEAKVETVTETVEVPVLDDEAIEKLASAVDELAGVAGKIVAATNEISGALAKARKPAPQPVARPAARPSAPAPRQAAPPQPRVPRDPGSGELTGPQQRILDALAWLEAVGFPRPTKIQVGFIAGYRVGKRVGGTFGNVLGQLRAEGLLDYPTAGHVELTPEGRALAAAADIEQSSDGLQQAVYARLDGPERRVLEVLVTAWPHMLSKQKVGEAAGYTVGDRVGGTFGNILGRLRSLGLIDYPSAGYAVATNVLFLEAA